MRREEIQRWITAMARQGADVSRLSVGQYAVHLMLMRANRRRR